MSNWVHYKNGNYIVHLSLDSGTKIRENNLDFFDASRPENMDIKITNRCNMGCSFCHENSTCTGKHSDALNDKFIETLPEWTECAFGGGNVLEYPDLIPFLQKCKTLHLVSNITVHQKHFMENLPLLRQLRDEKLIYGMGISLVDANMPGFIEAVKEFPNAVIHVINGVVTYNDLKTLSGHGLKILILGYKTVRRGKTYYKKESESIKLNQGDLYFALEYIAEKGWFDTISFDNLALKQLDPKRFLEEKFYDIAYMGDDGIDGKQTSASYYVDLVEGVFGRNSCDTEHRYPIGDKTAIECYQFLKNL